MKIKSDSFIRCYNLCAGLLDGITGILLICNPAFVLNFMFLSELPEDLVYLKYVGIFVLSTGISYFVPLAYKILGITFLQISLIVWLVTSLTRTLVSIFVFVKILQGELSLPWVLVGISDLTLAVFQAYLIQLHRGSSNAQS